MASRKAVNYLIGCDPELFLVDKTGAHRSAHDLIPGTKASPHLVSRGAIQPDGTAAEFNIDPAATAVEFTENIRSVLLSLQNHINEKDPELRLKVVPTAFFSESYFKDLPPAALEFGCTPDYNAYTSKANEFNGTKETFRTGAGHVHVGWTSGEDPQDTAHFFDCMQATRQLDVVLYFSSLLWDTDSKRRELYGKIGAFRPKSYGSEYRSISNAWVADPDLHTWIFNATTRAMVLLDKDGVQLWEDLNFREYVKAARAGKEIPRGDLLDINEDLVQMFDIPPLPSAYTQYHLSDERIPF